MQNQRKIKRSYTLINSTNNKNKKIFLKKNFLFNVLLILCFVSFKSVNAQEIDSNGLNIFYYSNGIKSSEGFFKNGLPDSLWKTYNQNGTLVSEGYKKNGLSDSTWSFFDHNGIIKQLSYYEKGLKNGCTITYDSVGVKKEERFYINDTLQNEVLSFYPSGEVKSVTNYEDGIKNKESIEYTIDGEISLEEFYEDGELVDSKEINRYNQENKKEGYWREYHSNGKLKSEANYSNGKLNGLIKRYNKYGSLESIDYMSYDSISNNSRELALIEMYKEFHPNTAIEKLVGGKVNDMKNGLFREYDLEGNIVNGYLYENDTMIAEGVIRNDGNFEGEWTFYYPDGKVQSKGEYINGKRNGQWVYYFNNGKVQQKGTYKDEVYVGNWVWYYENGAIRLTEFYNRKGKLEGTVVEYDELGNEITKGEYYNGMREGEWFYHIGGFKQVGAFTLGFKNGMWHSYYNDGSLLSEGFYDEGQPKGKHKTYHTNGVNKSKGKYKAGSKHGRWYTYNELGEPIESLDFEYGELVRINGQKIVKVE